MDRYLSHFPTTKEALSLKLGDQRARVVVKDYLGREWVRKDGVRLVLTPVGEAALRRYLGLKG